MSFYRTPDGTHYHINMGCKHIAGNPNVITCDGSDGLAPCTDCVLGGNRGLGDGTPIGGGATLVVTGGGGQYRLDHPDMTGMHYERHGGERVAVPDGCHLEGPDGMLVDDVTERLRQELRKLNEETDWQVLSDYDRNWRPPERDAFDMNPAPERPYLVEDRKAEIRGIERQISARQMQLSQHGESIARMTMEQDRERTQAPTPEEVIEDVASDATENPRGVIARGERLTSQGRGEASRPLPSGSKGIKGLRFIMESRHMRPTGVVTRGSRNGSGSGTRGRSRRPSRSFPRGAKQQPRQRGSSRWQRPPSTSTRMPRSPWPGSSIHTPATAGTRVPWPLARRRPSRRAARALSHR